MKISEKGVNLIKSFESLSLSVYKDIKGVNTVGYGHCTTMQVGETITQSQANELLYKDIEKAMKQVNSYDGYNFTQNEYDALVSFAFNIGSIKELTNNGTRTKSEIRNKIIEYCNANHKFVQGLYNRRLKEQQLFDGGNMLERRKYSYKAEKNNKVQPNFLVKEFVANNTKLREQFEKGLYDDLYISSIIPIYLQKVRTKFGIVTITSGYRPKEYNHSVNGKTSSYHIVGGAVDFSVKGTNLRDVAKYLLTMGCIGIGLYPTFIHIDDRENKYLWEVDSDGNTKQVSNF